ncbi:hypothetical protein OH77DRAFT_344248 [Trametes cingulata]|nr:hypothetical protein OH77DRAFT_344248 [Trametes cingulata]
METARPRHAATIVSATRADSAAGGHHHLECVSCIVEDARTSRRARGCQAVMLRALYISLHMRSCAILDVRGTGGLSSRAFFVKVIHELTWLESVCRSCGHRTGSNHSRRATAALESFSETQDTIREPGNSDSLAIHPPQLRFRYRGREIR